MRRRCRRATSPRLNAKHALEERRVLVLARFGRVGEHPLRARLLHPESGGGDHELLAARDVVVRDREERNRPRMRPANARMRAEGRAEDDVPGFVDPETRRAADEKRDGP